MTFRDGLENEACAFVDPLRRSEILRAEILRKISSAREATAQAIREREVATRGEERINVDKDGVCAFCRFPSRRELSGTN